MIVPLAMGSVSLITPAQLPGEHTALLPSRRWQLYPGTQAITVQPGILSLLDRERAHTGEVPWTGTQFRTAAIEIRSQDLSIQSRGP